MVIEDVYLSFNEIIEKALKHNKDKPHVKEEVIELKRRLDLANKGNFEDILNPFSRVDNSLSGGRRNQSSVSQKRRQGCSNESDAETMEVDGMNDDESCDADENAVPISV